MRVRTVLYTKVFLACLPYITEQSKRAYHQVLDYALEIFQGPERPLLEVL